MNRMKSMDWIDTIEGLKRQLTITYQTYGRFTHPEVVKASQRLDLALNELEASIGNYS